MYNTCIQGHICNGICYDDVHVDIGYDIRTYPPEDRDYNIMRMQEAHDRNCMFPFPHKLTVISLDKATEAPEIEIRYPGNSTTGGIPFLMAYRWSLIHPTTKGANHATH